MKGTAHQQARAEVSASQLISVADAPGRAIDCLGYDEALLMVMTTPLGGTDPVLDVKWQESADGATAWADIAGAAHSQVMFDNNRIVVSVNLTNASFTIAAQPVKPAQIVATVTDTTPSIIAGTLYVTGTDQAGNPQTELLTVASFTSPIVYRSTKVFKTVTSIVAGVVAGVAGTVDFTVLGGAGNETIIVGVDNAGLSGAHIGRLNLQNRKRYIRAFPVRGGTTPTGGYTACAVLLGAQRRPTAQVLGAVEFNI